MTKTKEINQEKVFNWLWPDKCWHKWITSKFETPTFGTDTRRYYRCCENKECDFHKPLSDSVIRSVEQGRIDLLSPDGMVMILDRLVEMGYTGIALMAFSSSINHKKGWVLTGLSVWPARNDGCYSTQALAVLSAVESLIEKEEKE